MLNKKQLKAKRRNRRFAGKRKLPLFLCTAETQAAEEAKKREMRDILPIYEPKWYKKVYYWHIMPKIDSAVFKIKGVLRVIRWFKTIISTRPWDYVYILMIHRQILEEVLEEHRENGEYIGQEHVVRDLEICLELLNRKIGDRTEYDNPPEEDRNIDLYFDLMKKRINQLWT